MQTARAVKNHGALSVMVFAAGWKRMMGMRIMKRTMDMMKGTPASSRSMRG